MRGAREALAPWPQVTVSRADAAAYLPREVDTIVASAGATHPLPQWLDALSPGLGQLLLPLHDERGWGQTLLVTARGRWTRDTPRALPARSASTIRRRARGGQRQAGRRGRAAGRHGHRQVAAPRYPRAGRDLLAACRGLVPVGPGAGERSVSMPKLIPSLRVIRRTLECEIAYTLSRMAVLERIPGNPVGIAYRQLEGGAVALMARHLPVPSFNSVVGLRAGHEGQIEPLVAWYRATASRRSSRRCPDTTIPRSGASWRGSATTSRASTPRWSASRTCGWHPRRRGRRRARRVRRDAGGLSRRLHAGGASRREPSSRPTCAPGSASPAGSSIWGAPMGVRRPPPSSSCTTRSATAPTPRPIRPSAAAACRRRCWPAASPTPAPPASTSCAAAPSSCPRATATWSGGHARAVRPLAVDGAIGGGLTLALAAARINLRSIFQPLAAVGRTGASRWWV